VVSVSSRRSARFLYSPGTPDKALAKRRLARMNTALANGETIDAALKLAGAEECVRDYADS
jgi:hypothetical protein